MHLSVHGDDPGYELWQQCSRDGKHVVVLLNGKEMKHVRTADTDKGCIEVCMLDADGNLQVEGDQILTELLFGDVSIVLKNKEITS